VAELWDYIGCMSHRHLNRQFFVHRTNVPKPFNRPIGDGNCGDNNQ
jgi:hypothetical protein